MMFSSSALLGCQNGAGTVTYTVSASSKSCWEVIFQCQDRQLTVAPDRSRTYWTHYSLFAYVSVTGIQVSMYRVYKSLELNIWSTTRCFVAISPIKLHAPTARCVSINIPSTFLKPIRKGLVLFRKHLQNQVVSCDFMPIHTFSLALSLCVYDSIHSCSELSYLSTRWVTVWVNMWHMDGLQTFPPTVWYLHLDY